MRAYLTEGLLEYWLQVSRLILGKHRDCRRALHRSAQYIIGLKMTASVSSHNLLD